MTTILFVTSFYAFGQQQKIETNPYQQPNKINVTTVFSHPTTQAIFSHSLPNGNKVYLLPQDQMSCVVPDMSKYNYHMPVAKGRMEDKIPNASPSIPIIPQKKVEINNSNQFNKKTPK